MNTFTMGVPVTPRFNSVQSDSTDIPNTFMNEVSAHGELEHVVLSVR